MQGRAADKVPERYEKVALWLMVAGISAIVLCVIFYVATFRNMQPGNSADWGTFGDFLSGVAGTVLSGATLVAVALTLSLQARELRESRALVEEQASTLRQEAFDSTFFKLVERFSEISANVRVTGELVNFGILFQKNFSDVGNLPDISMYRGAANYAYTRTFTERFATTLGPYYRTFYHVLKFVHRAKHLSHEQRADYVSLVRAQFGAEELAFLMLNVTSSTDGRKSLLSFVENYGLLKHIKDQRFEGFLAIAKPDWLHPNAFRSSRERAEALASGEIPPAPIAI